MSHANFPKIGIVLVNWNGAADTITCLQTIFPVRDPADPPVVVVDNASPDHSRRDILHWLQQARVPHLELREEELETTDRISADASEVILVAANHNRGFSAGNNIGIRLLLRYYDPEYVFLLNNDTVLCGDTLGALRQSVVNRPDTGIWGCTIVEFDNRQVVQCAGGARFSAFIPRNRPAGAGKRVESILNVESNVQFDYIAGAAMLIKSDFFKKSGLLNEAHFLYYEELDLAQRLKAQKYSLGWVPNALVAHKGGASTGAVTGTRRKRSAFSEYHANLSFFIYLRNHHRRTLFLQVPIRFLLKFASYCATLQPGLLFSLIKACRDQRLTPGLNIPRV